MPGSSSALPALLQVFVTTHHMSVLCLIGMDRSSRGLHQIDVAELLNGTASCRHTTQPAWPRRLSLMTRFASERQRWGYSGP